MAAAQHGPDIVHIVALLASAVIAVPFSNGSGWARFWAIWPPGW